MTFKEKVKKFWQEHKTGIIIGGITTGAVIIGCILSANREDDSDLDYDFYEDTKLPDPPKSTCECDSVFTDDGSITTGAIIIGCILSANREDDSDLDYDFYEDTKLPDPPESTCECDSVFADDFCTRNWNDELYRENWDKINEFAKMLKLQKGESYVIEDSERYYDEPWYTGAKDGHTLVSHLIDGEGCYPPANKEEEVA